MFVVRKCLIIKRRSILGLDVTLVYLTRFYQSHRLYSMERLDGCGRWMRKDVKGDDHALF
jgi:hypothetical protein